MLKMIPKQEILKRLLVEDATRSCSMDVDTSDRKSVSKISLRDQASLLLSIADIAQSEITFCPSALSDKTPLPSFPSFERNVTTQGSMKLSLAPRTESLFPSGIDSSSGITTRARSISIDSPEYRTPSPLSSPPPLVMAIPITPTPTNTSSTTTTSSRSSVFRSARLSHKARREQRCEQINHTTIALMKKKKKQSTLDLTTQPSTIAGKALQGKPPSGVTVKMIARTKFSWKNYRELEQFLIANREEYLRHSALNYTLQQKQYNNRLTERLLELSTAHGYFFDESQFSFVTVRDRIRCYYKSFVQSAKKRGILMGYAARKAGLLSDTDLEQSASQEGEIITPQVMEAV